jgi:hydroxylamine reductase
LYQKYLFSFWHGITLNMYIKYNFKGVTMFCVQCEQTIRTPAGNGCSYAQGMCGKTAETSDLQDLLIASCKACPHGRLKPVNMALSIMRSTALPRAFFSTLTNVNFDSPRIVGYAREAIALREALKAQCLSVDASAASITRWPTCSW